MYDKLFEFENWNAYLLHVYKYQKNSKGPFGAHDRIESR